MSTTLVEDLEQHRQHTSSQKVAEARQRYAKLLDLASDNPRPKDLAKVNAELDDALAMLGLTFAAWESDVRARQEAAACEKKFVGDAAIQQAHAEVRKTADAVKSAETALKDAEAVRAAKVSAANRLVAVDQNARGKVRELRQQHRRAFGDWAPPAPQTPPPAPRMIHPPGYREYNDGGGPAIGCDPNGRRLGGGVLPGL